MAEHHVQILRLIPKGKNNHHYVAVCDCGRWRSEPYREREHAETKGLAHTARGDAHLRALAAQDRGTSTLRTQFRYYTEQAEDPLNSDEDRELWRQLADELRPRVEGALDQQDEPLFSD